MSTPTSLFHLRYPIIQAPMAGVQDWELAAEVSATGGLGSIPCAMLTPDAVRASLLNFRTRTDNPANLNFFCHHAPPPDSAVQQAWFELFRPYYEELDVPLPTDACGPGRQPFNQAMADLLAELKPEVVSFHFGLPETDLLEQVRRTGAVIMSSATTVEEARWLEKQGVDAIIVQGLEAGGHRGMFLSSDINTQMECFTLLPQIIEAVDTPVIAAGGIADAKSVKLAMDLGAVGVQAGTAYLLCPEAKTPRIHRAALQDNPAQQTVLTNLFSGRPARGIVNRMIRELGPINAKAPTFPLATAASAPLRTKAESLDSGDFSPLWAGQNYSDCKAMSAAEVTLALASHLMQE